MKGIRLEFKRWVEKLVLEWEEGVEVEYEYEERFGTLKVKARPSA